MAQGYITHYEIWINGQSTAWGNQSLTVKGEGPTDADQFYRSVTSQIAEQAQCDRSQVRILGVFKL